MGRALLKCKLKSSSMKWHAAKDTGDPSEDYPGLFGWIRPTLHVSDSRMVRTVGLDAVVVSVSCGISSFEGVAQNFPTVRSSWIS
jgi:hypothetical protein